MDFESMMLINVITNAIAINNSIKGDELMHQMLINQHYIMLSELKRIGIDVDALEEKLEKGIQWEEENDRWVWNG